MRSIDVVQLAKEMISIPSVTPDACEIIDYLKDVLESLEFKCQIMTFESEGGIPVKNLFARYGTTAPHLCFAGHVDVVPAGDIERWQYDPFGGEIQQDNLYGRGAVDMKGAIAAFIAGLNNAEISGSISLLITGDEEGDAINGTVKVLEELNKTDNIPNVCIVGEPTSENWVGDTIKIGRRGSLSAEIIIAGRQGHVAYPQRADNPIPRLTNFLEQLYDITWDQGNENFDPTHLEVTSLDAENIAGNVIPGQACAKFNIRYNDEHARNNLIETINELVCKIPGAKISYSGNAEPFVGGNPSWTDLVAFSVQQSVQKKTTCSTTGGTSDARFIYKYCPVVELGLLNRTAHQIDEHVPVADLRQLQAIYSKLITNYFQCAATASVDTLAV